MTWLLKDPVLAAACIGTALPFLAMLTILILTRHNQRLSATISIGSISTSLLCAVYLFVKLFHAGVPLQYEVAWAATSDIYIPFGYLLDPHSILMLLIVATIAFLVQIYSLGYMAGDPGFSRYYAFQSLFAWAMLTMVIAPGMLQLYVFWELVGLASYLLIGFYYEKYSASQAGKKAFVVTRLGDIGFFLGLIFLLLGYGNLGILDITHAAAAHQIPGYLVTISAMLIFCGVIGKSAQFPLLTWLPDAMEGPTPVSALLHSATMVAAGVYMMSRIFPFFAASPDAMAMALAIGTVTMLLASTMAMATYDLKQVWAYSTVSQLGFMVMGLGAGSYFAGVFHLTTHAGFKALLFLCSGIFIHEFHTNDMRLIGQGGGRNLKIPMICMTIGAFALSGIFPFSGFFSKEAIMGALAQHPNKVWLFAGLLGALMTAYYSFRLIFFVAFPRKRSSRAAESDHGHGHGGDHEESHGGYTYWAMAWPVMFLAAVSCVLGFAEAPLHHFLVGGHEAEAAAEAVGHSMGHYILLATAIGCALAGLAWAWVEFGRKRAAQEGFLRKYPFFETLFARRWYLDDFYRKALDGMVYGAFTSLFTRNDRRVIDGAIDGICKVTIGAGRVTSFMQSGMLQYNLLVMVAGVGLVMLFFFI